MSDYKNTVEKQELLIPTIESFNRKPKLVAIIKGTLASCCNGVLDDSIKGAYNNVAVEEWSLNEKYNSFNGVFESEGMAVLKDMTGNVLIRTLKT